MSPLAEIEGMSISNPQGDLEVCAGKDDKTILETDNPAAATTLQELIRQNPNTSLQLCSDINGYVTVEGKAVACIKVNTGSALVLKPAI
jgi:hypothetical protein